MWYALNDPIASFVFIYCVIVWKCMLKCVLRVRIKIYILSNVSYLINIAVLSMDYRCRL